MGKITDIANKPILINELFELLPLGVVVIDDGGHLHMVNEKTVKMFDYAKSEIIGQPLEILLPEYLQSAHIDHRKQFFSAPQTRTMGIGLDLVGRKKDGREFPIEVGLSSIESSGRTFAVGFVSDISKRKQATEALLESESRYHSIIDNMIEGFQIIGFDWRYLYLNDAAARYGRIPQKELLGHTVMEKYPGIEQTEMFATLRDCMEKRVAKHAEFEFTYPDGSTAWFKFSIQPIPEGIFILSLDVTERKQAEVAMQQLNEELERRVIERTTHLEALNKELEAFSYSVSHDLRAPLRAIDGFSQALLEDYEHQLDDEGQEYLHFLRAECQQMGQLIDDLIELSRYTRSEIHYKNVDLSAIAQQIAETLLRQEPHRKAEFVIADGVKGYGDESLLRVVLQNLLGNAWKYTAKQAEARIEFGYNNQNGTVEYFVRDNGVGFNMAYAHKIFGAFQRLHGRHDFEGTGIGLATVQRIIRRHGGTVRAEGTVNVGATLYFILVTGIEEK